MTKETRLFLRLVLVVIGLSAVFIGLFAPERVQEGTAAWLVLP